MSAGQFERCRVYGHNWNSMTITFADYVWIDQLECEHCGTVRKDYVRRGDGIVYRRYYTYPPGYRLPKGERLTREDVGKLRLGIYERSS